MKKLLLLLEVVEETEFNPPSSFYIGLGILLFILIIPWIALLIYCLTLKYRVRLFSDGILIGTYKFKAGTEFVSLLEIPVRHDSQVEGLYRDDSFMLPLEFEKMPKENLKLYIKWEKK